MDLDDLRRWFLEHHHDWRRPERFELGSLGNHQLAWNYFSPARGCGAANVEPLEGAALPGIVMVVNEPFLRGMDAKEGHPQRYRRTLRPVAIGAREVVQAWVYAVQPEFRQPDHIAPSSSYLQLMLGAARRHRFPAEYVVSLEALLNNVDDR